MTIQQTKTQAGYFKGQQRFGRTTKLVEKATGRVLIEVMGACTRRECWKAFEATNR